MEQEQDKYGHLTEEKLRKTIEEVLNRQPVPQSRFQFWNPKAYEAFDKAVRAHWEECKKKSQDKH